MTDGHSAIKGRQSGAQHGGCVSLYQDQRWPLVVQVIVQRLQAAGGQGGKGLAGPHQIQVNVRPYAKDFQNLIQHFPVLSGHTDPTINPGVAAKCQYHRSQLNGLRPGAQDDTDFHAGRR